MESKNAIFAPPSEEELAETSVFAPPTPEEIGEDRGILGSIAYGFDKYSGAPARAGVGALMDGSNPLSAAWNQFGKEPESAPSSIDLSKKAGFSPKPFYDRSIDGNFDYDPEFARDAAIMANLSPEKLAEFGFDVGADLTNIIPFLGAGTKVLSKAGPVSKGVEAIGKTSAGTKIAKGVQVAKELPGKAFTKIASQTTGVPEGAISAYSKNPKEVDALIGQYGEDTAQSADSIRNKFNSKLEARKTALSTEKTAILQSAADRRVSLAKTLEAIEEAKNGINPKLRPAAHAELRELQNRIVQSVEGLDAAPAQAEEIKSFLQEMASSSYLKDGQMMAGGDKVQRAAKKAASTLRGEIIKTVPDVAPINREFERMFIAQRRMNKNLIKEGSPEAALIAAGSGSNPRNRKMLENISKLADGDFVKDAELLAAQKHFANPQLFPADTTGKALARMVGSSAAGSVVGGIPGAVVGALASSPAALKKVLRLKALAGEGMSSVAGRLPRAASLPAVSQTSQEASGTRMARRKLNRKARLKAMGE